MTEQIAFAYITFEPKPHSLAMKMSKNFGKRLRRCMAACRADTDMNSGQFMKLSRTPSV